MAHWTQTEEGKKRMSRIQKKRWRDKEKEKVEGESKAERVVRRSLKSQDTKAHRLHLYDRAAQMAVNQNELGHLTTAIGKAVFLHLVTTGGDK